MAGVVGKNVKARNVTRRDNHLHRPRLEPSRSRSSFFL
jgi:hypothetical protein